MNSAHITI